LMDRDQPAAAAAALEKALALIPGHYQTQFLLAQAYAAAGRKADADKAFAGVLQLAASPEQVLPLLRERLKSVPAPDPAQIVKHIADLENERFDVRKRATDALEKFGELAGPAMQKRLADNPPLEVRQRLESLLAKLAGPVTDPETLRAIRAVEVLEKIGTPDAQAILRTLAKGAEDARLTQDAKAALERLERRN
ncbi:MAG: tetratricopeptide repeat protein, partial [Gemmataceae bacterium]|nr:tetratricopeptide repeat protein [Gemmataceae bacterium]